MIKVKSVNFWTDKIEFVNNHQSGNFQLFPKMERRLKKESDFVHVIGLTLKIESNSEKPFPINLIVEFNGRFTFDESSTEMEIIPYMEKQAVSVMYPYLRSLVTNLSVDAMINPIILPIIDATQIFPDNKVFS